MSEVPLQETLDTYQLEGHPLSYWLQVLNTDYEGEATGHLRTFSRYGRNGEECSYWALACEVIAVEANGPSEDVEASLEYFMVLTVNDSPTVAEIVVGCWNDLPLPLAELLGSREDVMELLG